MTTAAERIELMMKALSKDQPSFGALAGATKSVVNQWLSGKIKSIDPRYAFELQKKTGFNAEWIMLGGNCPQRVGPDTKPSGGELRDQVADYVVAEGNGVARFAPSERKTAPATIEQLVEIASTMSPEGQWLLLGRAQELALIYPAAKANSAS